MQTHSRPPLLISISAHAGLCRRPPMAPVQFIKWGERWPSAVREIAQGFSHKPERPAAGRAAAGRAGRARDRACFQLRGQQPHRHGWASELGAMGVQRGGRETGGMEEAEGMGKERRGRWRAGAGIVIECRVQGQETRVQAAALPPASCATLTSDLTSLCLSLLRRRGQAGAACLACHPFSGDESSCSCLVRVCVTRGGPWRAEPGET